MTKRHFEIELRQVTGKLNLDSLWEVHMDRNIIERDLFEAGRNETDKKGEDKRKKILEDAETCVCTDRNLLYGEPEDSFRVITAFWKEYLNTHCMRDGKLELEEIDSKNMMILFKMARITTAKKASRDSYVDLCGYAAIAGEEVSE